MFSVWSQARSQLYRAWVISALRDLVRGHLRQLYFACAHYYFWKTWLYNILKIIKRWHCAFGGSWSARAQNREKHSLWSSSSSIFFVSSFVFWAFHDYKRLNYPLLRSWIPNTLWYNGLYYPFNFISILFLPIYVYGLIIYSHVCYTVLIIGKYFYPNNLKELLGNPCLGIKWYYIVSFMHLYS